MNKLDLNLKEVHSELVEFLRESFKKAGFSKAVLGLSGGIDSALVAYLLKDALGKENVLAIMMPYKSSNPDSLNHAKLVVEDLGINSKTIEITEMIDAYFKNEKDPTSLRMGNKMARERMSILFDYSSKENALVVGTSNKTEIYLGYSTQFGDAACAFNPIGDLYKTNVWELSRYLNIPKELIEKKPSADLWEGQTDEQEMGLTYKEADQVLYRMLEENKTVEEIATPTTEAVKETTTESTTTAPTSTASTSSEMNEISLADTKRVGREDTGYVNIPKDWVLYESKYSNQQFQYSSPDKYSLLTLNGYAKDTVELGPDETFGARLIADRLYSYWQNDKNQTILQGSKTIFALESAFLMKVAFSDGKHLFQWVFQKGDKVYSAAIESSANIVTTLRPFIEQSWSLDPNTPGK